MITIWLHKRIHKKYVCNDYLPYLQVGSYFHTLVYVIVYLVYLLAYVASLFAYLLSFT